MKACSKCGAEKPWDQYYMREGKPYNHCMDCSRAIARARWERIRGPLKTRTKQDPTKAKACKDCGEVKDPTGFYMINGRLYSYCKKCTCYRQKLYVARRDQRDRNSANV